MHQSRFLSYFKKSHTFSMHELSLLASTRQTQNCTPLSVINTQIAKSHSSMFPFRMGSWARTQKSQASTILRTHSRQHSLLWGTTHIRQVSHFLVDAHPKHHNGLKHDSIKALVLKQRTGQRGNLRGARVISYLAIFMSSLAYGKIS